MKCADLFKLSSTSKMQLIAGKGGLDNNIRWVYFWDTVEVEDCTKWIENNEIIIITGSHIAQDLETLPNYFPELVKKHVAGIIFSVGPFIKDIPANIIESANTHNIPIITVPWEVAIIKFSREICNTIILEEQKDIASRDLVKELVLTNNLTDEQLSKIMNDISLNTNGEYRVGVMQYDFSNNDLSDINFMKIASLYFYNMHFRTNATVVDNRYVFIFKDKHITSGSFQEDINKFIEKEVNKYGVKCYFGVGSICNSVRDFHKSYKEAITLANISSRDNKSQIRYYEQFNVSGLLNFLDDSSYRRKYYERYLKPVIDYDNLHNANLEETLYVFIDCNLSYLNAADKMYVHKNTLRYRIEKIEELLDLKLDNIETVSNILIAKNIAKFLDND